MRKFVSTLFLFLLFSLVLPCRAINAESPDTAEQTAVQQNARPVKVAVMPVIGAAGHYPSVDKYAYRSLKNALHIPLNGILNKAVYLDDAKTAVAANALLASGTDVSQKEGMKQLAAELGADLLVGVRISFIAQDVFFDVFDEDHLISRLGLQLLVYDSRTDKYIEYDKRQSYSDTYSSFGTVDAMAQDAMAYLLDKADLKQYLR